MPRRMLKKDLKGIDYTGRLVAFLLLPFWLKKLAKIQASMLFELGETDIGVRYVFDVILFAKNVHTPVSINTTGVKQQVTSSLLSVPSPFPAST